MRMAPSPGTTTAGTNTPAFLTGKSDRDSGRQPSIRNFFPLLWSVGRLPLLTVKALRWSFSSEAWMSGIDGFWYVRFPCWMTQERSSDGLAHITDIDELKRSREALVASERELRLANSDLQQFAYSASHDLQEPIRTTAL